jgi:hypothetical protein
MTLAVARIAGERIAIVSDTLISQPGGLMPVDQGMIKTCIVNCSICVAFSNSPELAARDILAFASQVNALSSFSKTVEYFEHSSRSTGNDYIIGFNRPTKIVKIANGQRTDNASRTLWIGDAVAASPKADDKPS